MYAFLIYGNYSPIHGNTYRNGNYSPLRMHTLPYIVILSALMWTVKYIRTLLCFKSDCMGTEFSELKRSHVEIEPNLLN